MAFLILALHAASGLIGGGRNSEIFPVNANEAEGRRLARFEPFGFTGGVFQAANEESNPDFPYTLDLRR